jgi:hypothetical protein
VTNCGLTANTVSRLEELKKVTASDGVHFIGTGYTNLAQKGKKLSLLPFSGEVSEV